MNCLQLLSQNIVYPQLHVAIWATTQFLLYHRHGFTTHYFHVKRLELSCRNIVYQYNKKTNKRKLMAARFLLKDAQCRLLNQTLRYMP